MVGAQGQAKWAKVGAMGGGARALVRQPKTAVFLRKLPKPSGSKSVN